MARPATKRFAVRSPIAGESLSSVLRARLVGNRVAHADALERLESISTRLTGATSRFDRSITTPGMLVGHPEIEAPTEDVGLRLLREGRYEVDLGLGFSPLISRSENR